MLFGEDSHQVWRRYLTDQVLKYQELFNTGFKEWKAWRAGTIEIRETQEDWDAVIFNAGLVHDGVTSTPHPLLLALRARLP